MSCQRGGGSFTAGQLFALGWSVVGGQGSEWHGCLVKHRPRKFQSKAGELLEMRRARNAANNAKQAESKKQKAECVVCRRRRSFLPNVILFRRVMNALRVAMLC